MSSLVKLAVLHCKRVPTVDHVSSNGGHCTQDGWMDAANCSSRPCSPDVYTVRVHARVLPKCLAIDVCDAICSPSTVKRFLEANKLPHKEGHAALPLTCPLCERETFQTVFINKTTGDWCAFRARSTVSWSALVDRVELSGNVVALYERVLCEIVNW